MPDGHIEIDERFMPEWVGYGVAQLEAYLGNQARFDDHYAERDAGFIYAHGAVLRKVPQDRLVDELFAEVDAWIAGGMVRPERRTRKHALPLIAG